MSTDWRSTFCDRLEARLRASGACAYSAQGSLSPEPTAIAALALTCANGERGAIQAALNWLVESQRTSGEIGSIRTADAPAWPTGLALWAWRSAPTAIRDRYNGPSETALAWLLRSAGRPTARSTSVETHDTELVGWPWVAGTHSWVEPTAYALLALRACGRADHARFRDGVRLLADRAIPGGGWNYGNRELFGSQLHAFPESTGVALAALGGQPPCAATRESIDFLCRELPRIHSPLSVGWGVFGLRAWTAAPPQAELWLAETAAAVVERSDDDLHYALLLLAGAARLPWEAADAA